MNPAGRGRRHRNDFMAAIRAMQGLALDRAVGFQIVQRHPAAGRADAGDNFFRDRPLVKSALAVAADRFEYGGEVGLNEPLSTPQRASIRMQKNPRRRRPTFQPGLRGGKRIGEIILDLNAVAGERDGRRDKLGQRKFSRTVFAQGERQGLRRFRVRRRQGRYRAISRRPPRPSH